MSRLLALLFVLIALAGPMQAQCVGQNLIKALDAEDLAELEKAAATVPYPKGNFWRATRGDQTVTMIGTYHFDDPRHAIAMSALEPLIKSAATVLVEAGPDEEKALKAHISRDPGVMMIMTGPTLIDQLPKDEWKALADAMRARGIPSFMAAKFQPWYVAAVLGVPPCAMATAAEAKGLDGLVIEAAAAAAVPIRALEPYDTVFGVFGAMSNEDQLALIKSTLAMEGLGADFSVTLADAYFAEDSRLIWEFMRKQALATPGYTPEQVDAEFAVLEENMMSARNRKWLPVIEEAVRQGPVLAAFGALHLSGDEGVLALLEGAGFTLERLSF